MVAGEEVVAEEAVAVVVDYAVEVLGLEVLGLEAVEVLAVDWLAASGHHLHQKAEESQDLFDSHRNLRLPCHWNQEAEPS